MKIDSDDIETAFSSLRVETRASLETDLAAALKDTVKDFNNACEGIREELGFQIISIEVLLGLSKKVSKEYAEICQGG